MMARYASCCVLTAICGAAGTEAGETPAASDIAASALPVSGAGSDGSGLSETGSLAASVVQLVLNGDALPDPVIIAESENEVLLPEALLSQSRIRQASDARLIDGRRYIPASALGAQAVELDRRTNTLRIDCSADCFHETVIPVRMDNRPELSPVRTGGFLNYDIFAEGGDIDHRSGALLEAGLFSSAGSGVVDFACTRQHSETDCVRLDATWTIDRPSTATRLEIGDTVTGAGRWEAPARFGGIRLGTDFSLTPDFITFPTPSISGDATLPGVVDVMVDGSQNYSTDVPAGPFTLTDLPVVTGAGSAELVLTDVLGRQSIVTADYYTAPQLLRSGLSDWSLEAGFLRNAFGQDSSHYDEGFIAAGYARGISDQFTFQARSSVSEALQSAGVSGTASRQGFGVVQASAAVSQSNGRSGNLVDFSHEWRSAAFSVGSSVRYMTPEYRQFGQSRSPPRTTARTYASFSDDRIGSISLSWSLRDERERDDFSTFGLRYTRPVGAMSLNLSAIRLAGQNDATIAALSLTMPLGGGVSSSMGADYRNRMLDGDIRIRKSAPPAGGLGYSAQASSGTHQRMEAGIDYRTRIGDAAGIVSQVENRTAGRMTLRGGAAIVDGSWVVAPSITNSLAVVTVGDQPGVQVFQDRQLVGRTDKQGQIVLTRLRPFERNVLSFDPRDVSLDRSFGLTQAIVVPGLRTGHRVEFDVGRSSDVLAYIVTPDGAPISSRGKIANPDTGEAYPIGKDGRVFIEGARQVTRLQFVRNKVICEARIVLGDTPVFAPYRDTGTIPCLPTGRLR